MKDVSLLSFLLAVSKVNFDNYLAHVVAETADIDYLSKHQFRPVGSPNSQR